ncbi:MAG: acetyl-CoA carboxylase biotin carboxyl carrier protein subunit [Clostridiales bacterium]|nr:acetyl-CoA carboxylase biotin carboxyl carrier protein subunit [Clostridiales bacterium]
MKYIVSMNGNRYEVEVERVSPFHLLSHEEAAAGASAPVTPVEAPAPKAAPVPATAAPAPAPAPAPKAAPKAAPPVAPPPVAPRPAAPAPQSVAAAPAPAAPAGGTTVTSPLPGKVLSILATPGQPVTYGQKILTIEAMKMETEIVSSANGTLTAVYVKGGDAVESGMALFTVQ